MNLLFKPSADFVDLEICIHNAIREILQKTEILDCCFDHVQNWWRKIQDLGLNKDYKDNNSEIENFLECFFGLPFLQSDDISDCFTNDLMSIMPENTKVEEFCDYVLKNYIKNDVPRPSLIWKNLSLQFGEPPSIVNRFIRNSIAYFTLQTQIYLYLLKHLSPCRLKCT